MSKRKSMPGSTMSFIDAMSCGLGAAILIFFIIDFKSGSASGGDIEQQITELETQIQEYSRLNSDLGEEISATQTLVSRLASATADATFANANLEIDNSDAASLNAAVSAQLEEALKKQGAEVAKPEPALQGQLLGIKVQGPRIAILFDVSASMSESQIIDVIIAQATGPGALAQGKKWGQSRRLANWIVDQVPEGSQFDLIAFSEKAKSLSGGYIAKSNAKAVNALKADVIKAVPNGGTNLNAAVRYVSAMSPPPTNVYLVTDGLPTQQIGGRGGVGGCKAKSEYVSGRCRANLLVTAQQSWSRDLQIDVFLLHLEGDSKAAPYYYAWARRTGGVLFSPSQSWP